MFREFDKCFQISAFNSNRNMTVRLKKVDQSTVNLFFFSDLNSENVYI